MVIVGMDTTNNKKSFPYMFNIKDNKTLFFLT